MEHHLYQLGRFAMVGVLSTIIHVGTLTLMVEKLNQNPVPASALGFILAVVISYLCNYRWTFAPTGNHKEYFLKYVLVCVIGFILNISIMYLTVNIWGMWYLLGATCVLTIVPISNFLLNKFWVFAIKKDAIENERKR